KQESFEAVGRNIGEQLHQVFAAWLAARKLGGLTRKIESFQAEDVFALLRVIAPTLAEQARAWTPPAAKAAAVIREDGDDDVPDVEVGDSDVVAEAPDLTVEVPPVNGERRRSIARPLTNRIPPPLKLPALRLLELALGEDLGES